MTFTYPANDLDSTEALAALLGSFWTEVYDGRALLYDYLRGRAELEARNFRDAQACVAAHDNHAIDHYRRVRWHAVTLYQDEMSPADPASYGDGYVFGNQPVTGAVLAYGAPADRSVIYPVDADLRDFAFLTNAVTAPTVVLTNGVDLYLDPAGGRLVFLDDPFANPLIQADVDADGRTYVRVWLFEAALDRRDVQGRFGAVVGLDGPSSPRFRSLVSAVFDGVAGGTSSVVVRQAVAAMAGVDLVETDGETVEVVTADAGGKLVITDRRVYRFPEAATVVVSVGDEVNAGTWLTDTVAVFEPNRGDVPTAADVGQLSLGRGFLIGDVANELVFANRDVAVTTSTESGRLRVAWELGGFADDVDAFFDALHARGVADGTTLANLLDVRATPLGEPNATNLPATINPLRFLFENVLRHNAYVIRLRPASFGADAVGLQHAGVLRKLIPPHVALLIYVELADRADDVTMDGAGDGATSGYSESYEIYSV